MFFEGQSRTGSHWTVVPKLSNALMPEWTQILTEMAQNLVESVKGLKKGPTAYYCSLDFGIDI